MKLAFNSLALMTAFCTDGAHAIHAARKPGARKCLTDETRLIYAQPDAANVTAPKLVDGTDEFDYSGWNEFDVEAIQAGGMYRVDKWGITNDDGTYRVDKCSDYGPTGDPDYHIPMAGGHLKHCLQDPAFSRAYNLTSSPKLFLTICQLHHSTNGSSFVQAAAGQARKCPPDQTRKFYTQPGYTTWAAAELADATLKVPKLIEGTDKFDYAGWEEFDLESIKDLDTYRVDKWGIGEEIPTRHVIMPGVALKKSLHDPTSWQAKRYDWRGSLERGCFVTICQLNHSLR